MLSLRLPPRPPLPSCLSTCFRIRRKHAGRSSLPLGLGGIIPAQRDLLKSGQVDLFPLLGPNRRGTPGGERPIGYRYRQRVHYPYARSYLRPPFLNFRLRVGSLQGVYNPLVNRILKWLQYIFTISQIYINEVLRNKTQLPYHRRLKSAVAFCP